MRPNLTTEDRTQDTSSSKDRFPLPSASTWLKTLNLSSPATELSVRGMGRQHLPAVMLTRECPMVPMVLVQFLHGGISRVSPAVNSEGCKMFQIRWVMQLLVHHHMDPPRPEANFWDSWPISAGAMPLMRRLIQDANLNGDSKCSDHAESGSCCVSSWAIMGIQPSKVTPPNENWFILANEPLRALGSILVCHE